MTPPVAAKVADHGPAVAAQKSAAKPLVTAPTPKSAAPTPAHLRTPVEKTTAAAQAAPATLVDTPAPAKPQTPPTVPEKIANNSSIDAKISYARPAAPAVPKPRSPAPKHGFKLNEFIVYPAHGVGQIVSLETQEVAGFSLELYVVSFIKDKMILKVPTSKVSNVGMRKLAETNIVEKALSTLSGRARIKRTMWSRRAQEYEAKINSGDLVTIAEVVRDLYRSDTQPEQSYSERQLYEAALDRMAREIAAVRRLIDAEALKLIESFLQKGPKRGLKAEAEGDVGAEIDDADVDAAA